MSKKLGMFSILLGAALILSALFLYGYNKYEDQKSGNYADTVIEQVRENVFPQTTANTGTAPEDTEPAEEKLAPEMPEVMIDGYAYIGYIGIPDIEIELPVMADWDYDKMKISPCRQFGSSRTDDLVIAAHNYDSFFGRLKNLQSGAEVIVTDMEGIVNHYQVEKIETLEPTDVDAVQNSGYDLVLYTCTYGGATRVTVFCNRVPEKAE